MYAIRNWKLDFDQQNRRKEKGGGKGRRRRNTRILWHLQGIDHKMEASPQTVM